MPFVRSIYSALKQIFETVLSNKADMFSKVGIVEYPRKGVWSIVFVASEKDSEINSKLEWRRRSDWWPCSCRARRTRRPAS